MYGPHLELREVCFCGWQGRLIDRTPVYAGDGAWGLQCPRCGHLDELLPQGPALRDLLLRVATERQADESAAAD